MKKFKSTFFSPVLRLSTFSALVLLASACATDDDPVEENDTMSPDDSTGSENDDADDSEASPMDEDGESGEDEESVEDGEGDGTGEDSGGECEPVDDTVDESECSPKETDYQPSNTQDDPYDACISDEGIYELFHTSAPSSAARVVAFDTIAEKLWLRDDAPSADDFMEALTLYEEPEGLGSRVGRREDLHYPEIPEEEHVDGVEATKQCSVEELADKYPDRCAGPSKIEPIILEALIEGAEGNNFEVNAAKVRAAGLWFLYLSVYKEAFTCTLKGKDCDSSWAYYTGGVQVDGDQYGMARNVKAHSGDTHQRIFDGVLAVRCWRALYDIETYPTLDDIPSEGQDLFNLGWEQLDNALHRGYALILRQELLGETGGTCEEPSDAAVEFFKILAPVLDREAKERDETMGAEFEALWKKDSWEPADFVKGVELIDALFPCH